jgi:hypothetical protein
MQVACAWRRTLAFSPHQAAPCNRGAIETGS